MNEISSQFVNWCIVMGCAFVALVVCMMIAKHIILPESSPVTTTKKN